MTRVPAAGAAHVPVVTTSEHDDARTAQNSAWLTALQSSGRVREDALDALHALLLRAARFEVGRRRGGLPAVAATELDDLAMQGADDALVTILDHLDDFRGESLFTTWAYKFAIYETAVKLRRRAWQGREVSLEPESWAVLPDDGVGPEARAEYDELVRLLREGIANALTTHQRHILVALTLNGVPIDVLADRLSTTRGALYKTLHDARRKLRAHLAAAGVPAPAIRGEATR